MDREKAIQFLLERYKSIYCDTCRQHKETEVCNFCYPDRMAWGMSREEAESTINILLEESNE